LLDAEPIKELYHTLSAKNLDQESLIKSLRDLGFILLSVQHIEDFKIPINIKPKHREYDYYVRCIKEAKDPKNDKFDPQLAFGVKLFDEKVDKVIVYMYGDYYKRMDLPWANKKDINLKPQRFLVFPDYMTEEERIKYSTESRKLAKNPDQEPSKFFTRWQPFVTIRNHEIASNWLK
jgi:hypothetical protein